MGGDGLLPFRLLRLNGAYAMDAEGADCTACEEVVVNASPALSSASDSLSDEESVEASGNSGGDAGSVSVYQAVAPSFGRPLRALCVAAPLVSGDGTAMWCERMRRTLIARC